MKKLMTFLVLITLAAFLHSCGSSTDITGSWKNPKISDVKYDNILVASMTNNIRAKSSIESKLAEELRDEGVTVSLSSEVFPPNFTESNNDRQAMLDKIRDNGADAILTITLIDTETETRYVPGTYGYEPMSRFGYYGRFWGYYSHWYPIVYSPGYYTTTKTYFMEANLYDVNTEELLWSAQSETYDPANLESFAEGFAEKIVNEMENDGLLDDDEPAISRQGN